MTALGRERLLALAGTVILCLLAWRYLYVEAAGMSAVDMMSGMEGMELAAQTPGVTELGHLFVMWSVMMLAMMLPSALPTILLFAKLQENRRGRSSGGAPAVAALLFVLGYLLAWTGYSAAAATTQWLLQRALLVSPMMVSASGVLSGSLLLLAGIYQLTPIKDRCISHCRSPLSFLTSHWREGLAGAVRMGIHHGGYCVGCCWALMALLFVLGVMNLFWVLVLAALVLIEKTAPRRSWVTPAVGGTLMAAGAWVLGGAWLRGG